MTINTTSTHVYDSRGPFFLDLPTFYPKVLNFALLAIRPHLDNYFNLTQFILFTF